MTPRQEVDSSKELKTIELAITTASQLRKARVRPRGVARVERMGWHTLMMAAVLLVVAIVSALMQWNTIGLIAAMLSWLLAVGSLLADILTSVLSFVAVRRDLARRISAVHGAALWHAAIMWQQAPSISAWEHAVAALDHASRSVQQWRAFAAAFLALLLTLYLATRSPSCAFGTPLDLIVALPHWRPGLNPVDPCTLRGWLGFALLGMMAAVIPLQWKIGTLLNAEMLARRTLEHGRRSADPDGPVG